MDTVLDICEVAASCAYAAWLRKHKHLEPKMTFVEVIFGMAYTLSFSVARGAIYGGDWWHQSKRFARDLALAGTPIVLGEVDQWIDAQRAHAVFDKEYPG